MTLTGTLTPNPLSLRTHSASGSVGIRGAVGALKLRRPSQCERSGSGLAHGSADSRQRYCANLGHRQDDETGTYTGGSPDGDGLANMRARYYEPGTGRFISEDPERQGCNWSVYCMDNQVNSADANGREAGGWLGAVSGFFAEVLKEAMDHQNGDLNFLRVTLKTANGIQEGIVTAWAIRAIQNICEATIDGMTKAVETGGGAACSAIWEAGGYACLLVLAIDAIDVVGSECLLELILEQGVAGK